jgi:membrane fusion protein (multidrug efflux system)
VGRVYVDIGANVTAQTPVALVVSMNKVKIDLNIPERYLASISLNQKASIHVDAYPSEEFSGFVTKISPVFDTETRSMPVEITVDNKGHFLRSGMFARVSLIIDERKSAPLVLKESVMGKGEDTYVYIVENSKAVFRKVRIGIKQNEYFHAEKGLSEGDLVVIMGQQRLRDGSKVKTEQ